MEAVYAGWDRPARYQICPAALPEGLDSALQERGYIVDAPTSVQIAGTRMVLTAAQQRASRWQPFRLKVHDKLSLAWVSAYCLVQGAPPDEAPLRMAALARIVQPAVYVQLDVDGEPAAVGRAVLENGWCGVFGMATRPGFRRRGLATAALDALASQALEMNAGHMYLQVMLDNEAALNCYSGLGFRTLYGYHYRQQPSPGSVT